MSYAYPVPIYLPRRRRIISPAEWFREKLKEKEEIATKAIAFDVSLGTVTNSGTLTTSAAAASGSRVFVFVWWFGTQTCTGCGGGGLTYVVDHQFRGSGGGDQNQAIISADAPSGLASSTNIVPTFSATPDFGPGIGAFSATGIATGASGYLDVTSTGQDNFDEDWATNNLVTTNADDLLVGFSAVDNGAGTHSADANYIEPFAEWTVEGSQKGAVVYRIVSSTGTYNPGGVWTGTNGFQQNIGAAYKSGEATPPPEVTFQQKIPLFTGLRGPK